MCKKNGRNNPIKVHGNFVINGDSGTGVNNGKRPLHHSQKLQCLLPLFAMYFSIIWLYLLLYQEKP
jgi:hypothetical protein